MLFDLIRALRSKRLFKLVYWGSRVGLALTFILSGLRKLPGVRFTILPPDDPVGGFFAAMYETGVFWYFIGAFQILVGLLALFNRFIPLAVLLMMPVTVNIFLVSVGLHMRGTPIITTAMLLGNFYLLFWHFENYQGILERGKT